MSADIHRGQRARPGNQSNHAIKVGYKCAADFFTKLSKLCLLAGRHPYKSSWDGATLAEALSVFDDAVWRVLRKEGIQLQRMPSWCVSTPPSSPPKLPM